MMFFPFTFLAIYRAFARGTSSAGSSVMTENQNPEQAARDSIDILLRQAGWSVHQVLY